jgi:hypothetical protein
VSAELSTIAASCPKARSQVGLPPPAIVPTRYVLLPLAALATGYSIKAMERKIERGDWIQGKVWRRAPDGHIVIDLVGYQKWVEST